MLGLGGGMCSLSALVVNWLSTEFLLKLQRHLQIKSYLIPKIVGLDFTCQS